MNHIVNLGGLCDSFRSRASSRKATICHVRDVRLTKTSFLKKNWIDESIK